MTFKAILQALRGGGGLKFIDVTTNFMLFYFKKCNKIRLSPNVVSYLHMRIEKYYWEDCFLLINKLQPKTIYISLDR